MASIEILAGASLTIKESGEVLIKGEYSYTNGITCYGGSLINNGPINFFHIDTFSSKDFQEMVKGNGLIFLDGFALDGESFAKE
ncbi:MAG: hypothetical protein ACI9RM_000982 [Ulvibacter sp.]